MKKNNLIDLRDELQKDLEFESPNDKISEEELLVAIISRVMELLDTDSGLLFSYLYRLDIDEEQLSEQVLASTQQTLAERIGTLILERQKKRIHTKKTIDQGPPIEGWEW
jgi:hypothetical protein